MLQGVMLFVKDLDRMTAFYRDILELRPVEETRVNNWVAFEGSGVPFSLHAIPPAIASTIEVGAPLRAREQSVAKLTFAVRDVHATLAQIAAQGLPLLERPWGDTEAVDPEGNVIALRSVSL